MGALYDSSGFSFDIKSGYFHRNSLKVNMMSLKSAPAEKRQNLVTYNNMPFAKPEKRGNDGQPTNRRPKYLRKEFLTAKNAKAFGGKGPQASEVLTHISVDVHLIH
jgi:hypothetical protein